MSTGELPEWPEGLGCARDDKRTHLEQHMMDECIDRVAFERAGHPRLAPQLCARLAEYANEVQH